MFEGYISNPVVVHAVQLTEENVDDVLEEMQKNAKGVRPVKGAVGILVPTLEGTMHATPGQWIIRGTEGEYYPCKDSVFQRKYSPAIGTRLSKDR